MKLFRPVGVLELGLIEKAKFKEFPPRLYWQPVFYPVLTLEYARRIASEWNTKDKASGFCGFVTQFEVNDSFLSRYEVHVVGGAECQELWVPSEELKEFNSNIEGRIDVIEEYYGEEYRSDFSETDLPEEMLKQNES